MKTVTIHLADQRNYTLTINPVDYKKLMDWYKRDIPYGVFEFMSDGILVNINKQGVTSIETLV